MRAQTDKVPADVAALAGYACFLGFDVSKDTVAVFDTRTGKGCELPNRPTDLKRFLATYGQDSFAVCEPTGGYEAALLAALLEARIPTHRANTLHAKGFMRSLGKLAKTDAIDAWGLARYGQERSGSLALWSAKSADLERIQALVRRRADLVDMRVAETNRSKAPGAAPVKASLRQMLRALDKQIETIEAAIAQAFAASAELMRRVEAVDSVPGIGRATAFALVASMPELGSTTTKRIASLAGLAPHPRDSGTIRGYRRVRGGRAEVRTALFMPAMAAIRSHSVLAAFYKSLIGRGKKPIVALVAVMRKIVVMANARVRDAIAKQQS